MIADETNAQCIMYQMTISRIVAVQCSCFTFLRSVSQFLLCLMGEANGVPANRWDSGTDEKSQN